MKQKQSHNKQSCSYPHLPPIQSPISNNNSQTNNYEHTHLPRLKNVAIQTSLNHNQTQLNQNSQFNRNGIIIGTSSNMTNNQTHNITYNNPISSRSPRRNINGEISNGNNQNSAINNENPPSIIIREPERNQNPNNQIHHRYNLNNHSLNHPNRYADTTESNSASNASLNVKDDPWDDYIIKENDVKQNKNCAICINDYEIGERVIRLKCGHIFHKGCIIPWYDDNIISPTCPICRRNLSNFETENRNQINQNLNNIEYSFDEIDQRIDVISHLIEEISHRVNNLEIDTRELDQNES